MTLRKQGQMEKAAKALAALTAACIEEAVAAVEKVKANLTQKNGIHSISSTTRGAS